MFNWRWVFFINVPIGLVAAVGIFATLPEFPSIRRVFDHVGFIMIAVALCALQLALDRGTQQDWFHSTEIVVELGISAAAFWMLFFHLRGARSPIISIGLFKRRTFAVSMIFALTIMPTVIAATALLPTLMQVLLGYPVVTAGFLLIPRSFAMTFGIMIGGRLMKVIDVRIQTVIGLALVIVSLWIQSGFDLLMDERTIIISGLLQGLGAGLAMTIINFGAIAGAPTELRAEAAAVYSLFRSTGGALLISVTSALLARNIQVNHAELSSVITSGSAAAVVPGMLGGAYLSERVAAFANAEVNRQAMMIAYIDDFWILKWLLVCMIPLAFFIEPLRGAHMKRGEAAAAAVID
jgi:DHA2 family multidrug resistance protein